MTASTSLNSSNLAEIKQDFKHNVIERISITPPNQVHSFAYTQYLTRPLVERSGDEANAVDMQFARYTLEWLGFGPADWDYNQPQSGGQKGNRPDYRVKATHGLAFIWEDKNSTLDLKNEHLDQMRRYSMGTAGYAVWCNMRRILAVRLVSNDSDRYDIIADVEVEQLFGSTPATGEVAETGETNLALFQLFFSKARFSRFEALADEMEKIKDEAAFQAYAQPMQSSHVSQAFIDNSRQILEHLKLAASAQIGEARITRSRNQDSEQELYSEWKAAQADFLAAIAYAHIQKPVQAVIESLTPQLGNLNTKQIREAVWEQLEQAGNVTGKISVTLRSSYEIWLERASRVNQALVALHFGASRIFGVSEAFRVWSERQTDQEDIKVEIFAEQVAYVFFVRLLLVRVLEDKGILQPRIASDGGFVAWRDYIKVRFKELAGVSILNNNYHDIILRKAGSFYMHFFQQAVFDWFNPDDFLLLETLEFLSRFNFKEVASDIIGFTYEGYIERTARNRKGHFLTRGEVVEYMLDLLDYSGPDILGRTILDPACGSGSFLVHAARRYRLAQLESICRQHNLEAPNQLQAHPALRQELAKNFLEALTTKFFGMELTPFACYLAEMNLIIQALDDLYVLQQAGETPHIERFQIFNTNSLDLPHEILVSDDNAGQVIQVPDRLSERLLDEAYPLKARLGDFGQGFFYVIFNPPYVTSKGGGLDAERYRHAPFYKSVLSGDTNLYLLFLRLSLYYVAEYGRLICIIPLTIFGDRSAAAARKLLSSPPYTPAAAIRFYRGDVLFPGVDQAVGIVRVNRQPPALPAPTILLGGGETVQEAKNSHSVVTLDKVVKAVPTSPPWQGNWLVTNNQLSLDIWQQAKAVSSNFSYSLSLLLNATFDIKQGDVNATYLNPARFGPKSPAGKEVAIYKGEDVLAYAPLPPEPSDWAGVVHTLPDHRLSKEEVRASQTLEQLKALTAPESGIILREVARLNTRDNLIASWFERSQHKPLAFSHELWRGLLKASSSPETGKSLLALLNSKTLAYLYNLFSSNNHVSKEILDRLPIPDPATLPVVELARLAGALLQARADLENMFVLKYTAVLPDFDDGLVRLPPSQVLVSESNLPTVTVGTLVARGYIKNLGTTVSSVKSLLERDLLVSGLLPDQAAAPAFATVLNLFGAEWADQDKKWSEVQSLLMPDNVAATAFLAGYNGVKAAAQTLWQHFVDLQRQTDAVVGNWYGFSKPMQLEIAAGLPWARRHKPGPLAPAVASVSGLTVRTPVASSHIYAVGYDPISQTLELEFADKSLRQYKDVPLAIYDALMVAASKGQYFNKHIKGQFS